MSYGPPSFIVKFNYTYHKLFVVVTGWQLLPLVDKCYSDKGNFKLVSSTQIIWWLATVRPYYTKLQTANFN